MTLRIDNFQFCKRCCQFFLFFEVCKEYFQCLFAIPFNMDIQDHTIPKYLMTDLHADVIRRFSFATFYRCIRALGKYGSRPMCSSFFLTALSAFPGGYFPFLRKLILFSFPIIKITCLAFIAPLSALICVLGFRYDALDGWLWRADA